MSRPRWGLLTSRRGPIAYCPISLPTEQDSLYKRAHADLVAGSSLLRPGRPDLPPGQGRGRSAHGGRRLRRPSHRRLRRQAVRERPGKPPAGSRSRAESRSGALLHGRRQHGLAPAGPGHLVSGARTGASALGRRDRLSTRPRVLRAGAIRFASDGRGIPSSSSSPGSTRAWRSPTWGCRARRRRRWNRRSGWRPGRP